MGEIIEKDSFPGLTTCGGQEYGGARMIRSVFDRVGGRPSKVFISEKFLKMRVELRKELANAA